MSSIVKQPAVKHEELAGDIIGAAMAALNELKPGLEVALPLNFREACGGRTRAPMRGRSTTDFTDFTDGSRRRTAQAVLSG